MTISVLAVKLPVLSEIDENFFVPFTWVSVIIVFLQSILYGDYKPK